MDQEKLQAMLTEHTLAESCDLKRALENVALLEAQFEEMNPYLESISEYAFLRQFRSRQLKLSFSEFFLCSSLLVNRDYTRYQRKVSLYNGRVEDLNSVTQQRDDMKKQYDDLRKKRQVYPVLYLLILL